MGFCFFFIFFFPLKKRKGTKIFLFISMKDVQNWDVCRGRRTQLNEHCCLSQHIYMCVCVRALFPDMQERLFVG